MKVTKYPQQESLNTDDHSEDDHIEKLHEIIERALRDGKLSKKENDSIKALIYADKKVTSEESKLYRELQEKIWTGEIQIDTW